MKRKFLVMFSISFFSLLLAAALSVAAFIYFSRLEPSKAELNNKISEHKKTNLKNNYYLYNIKADIDVSENILNIKEEILLKTPSNKTIINIPSLNFAETVIKSISAGDKSVDYAVKDSNIEVDFKAKQSSLNIEYQIILRNDTGSLSYSNSTLYLTNFLLTEAVYKDDAQVEIYKYPFGDPYFYEINNYFITFRTGKDSTIFAPGEKQEYLYGSNKITIFEDLNVRDFPSIVCRNADINEETWNGIRIHYINASETKESAKYALDFAQKNIGPYPYKDFYVARAPISGEGMEFSGMIFLADKCFKDSETLKRVTYHEVFHQWFYGIIGTDQLNEPFTDEGLVTYLSLMLAGVKFNENYDNGFLTRKLSDYQTKDEYLKLCYSQSSAYFYTIYRKMGNNFYEELKKLYNEKKFQIVYYKDLSKYLN